MTPNVRVASTLPVRVIAAESGDFETEIRLAKQRELEMMRESISNNPKTGTTREQGHGNASYTEILDVVDYEIQPPPDSSPAKSFATARPFIGAQAPAGATVSDWLIAAMMGQSRSAAEVKTPKGKKQ